MDQLHFVKAPIAAFILIILSYLLMATLSALFILPVEQDADACLNVSYESLECIEWKNETELYRHVWNKKMTRRNGYLLLTFGIIPALIYAFYVSQKMKDSELDSQLIFGTAFMEGIALAFFGALLLSLILPPPVEWFPNFIIDFQENQIELIEDAINHSAGPVTIEKVFNQTTGLFE